LGQNGHYAFVVQCERWRRQDDCRLAYVFFSKILVLPGEWPRMAADRTPCIGTSCLTRILFVMPAGGAMALELAIICAAAGVFLGLRYSLLVLVPAVVLAMLFAVIVGIARADGVWSTVLLTAALGAAVQMGYLAGMTIYAAIESICAARSAALGLIWQPTTWRAHSLQLSPSPTLQSTIARLHRLQPPRA
jgi:hypothetical protein